ncbi:MAG: hypothetical protein AB8H03_15075 [Saprospiraceae bacterium]
MKNLILLLCLPFFFCFCNQMFTPSNYTSKKFHYKTLAILPFEIHTSVKNLPAGVTISMLEKAERRKSIVMQRDLYRYIIREFAKSTRKVNFQNVNETNNIFKKKGMDPQMIFNTPKKELAKILKVDAVIFGSVYQYKNKLNLNKDEEVTFSGMNNKISTVLYAYEKKRGRIQWKYDGSQSGFPSEVGPDVVKGLLRKAARNFPL